MNNNNPRIYLYIGLLLLLWLNYQQWNKDYEPALGTSPPVAAAGQSAAADASPPHGLDGALPTASDAPAPSPATPGPNTPSSTPPAASPPGALEAAAVAEERGATGGEVHVTTDVLSIDIALKGGELERADLLKYPLVKGQPELVRLLNRGPKVPVYVLQSGLLPPSGGATSERPTSLANFTAQASDYQLEPGANTLRVPLTWTDGHGVTVTKTFVFTRGGYEIHLDQQVENRSDAPWAAQPYAQILRGIEAEVSRPFFSLDRFGIQSSAGKAAAYDDGHRYQKLKFDGDDAHLSREVTGGWIASLDQHFVSAIVPPGDQAWHDTMAVADGQYLLSTRGPVSVVAPDSSADFALSLYVGPKLQKQLDRVNPRLYLVTDYGWLALPARPLFALLNWLHSLFGNWGWSIVVATAILKLIFYPLSEASGKSMAKMRLLQPRIKNLQETYKDEKDKLGKAMMELYQREKINPVAGCLPIVIQMPVFLAFYWVLLGSVEMRQAPFMGWITDLSSRDPLFILPALMAGAMFLQFKLNPTATDPVQQKVFMVMPFVMSFMFAFFPAGLVLYWVTNTILSIAQQWNINRRIGAATARA
jgi:YidC/Oxa1 family membrane protein insertase